MVTDTHFTLNCVFIYIKVCNLCGLFTKTYETCNDDDIDVSAESQSGINAVLGDEDEGFPHLFYSGWGLLDPGEPLRR